MIYIYTYGWSSKCNTIIHDLSQTSHKMKKTKSYIISKKIYIIVIILLTLLSFVKISIANKITIIWWPQTDINPTTTAITDNYSKLSNISYELSLLHIKIWTSNWNLDKINFKKDTHLLKTIAQAEILYQIDILDILKNSKNPDSILDNYLQEIDIINIQSDFFIMLLEQENSNNNSKLKSCIDKKNESDLEYFQWFNYYDNITMSTALQKSIQYKQCISQAQAEINSNNIILNKLSFYNNILKAKHTYIQSKKKLILKNIDILDPEILKDLSNISQNLNK